MTYRARAVLVAALAAGPVLPASVSAAECVRVVVDYGTLSGAPAGPNTRCVDVGSNGTAAEALGSRARYKGNFLCAIDGYPESGCGDHGTEPYWSFWVFRNGRWTYASEGVGTFRISDGDGDGHPDPIGFRYHAYEERTAPRANPAYPAPTTAPPTRKPTPAPTRPPANGGGSGGGPTAGTGSTGGGTGGDTDGSAGGTRTTTAPAAPGATAATVTPGGTTTPAATRGAPAPAVSVAAPSPTDTPPAEAGAPAAAPPAAPGDGGFPVGTVAGALLAAALLGGAVWQTRKPAA